MLSAVASAILRMRIASASADASADEANARGVGAGLRDLRRVQLGGAHEALRFLTLCFRLRDERGVRRLRLLELALLVGDRALGLELCFLRAARLLAATMSAFACASAADWRRRASATSDCTTLMLSELKIRPRSVSSREHALRMITASGSSSSSSAVDSAAVSAVGAG